MRENLRVACCLHTFAVIAALTYAAITYLFNPPLGAPEFNLTYDSILGVYKYRETVSIMSPIEGVWDLCGNLIVGETVIFVMYSAAVMVVTVMYRFYPFISGILIKTIRGEIN